MKEWLFLAAAIVVMVVGVMMAFAISPGVYRVRVLLLEIGGRWKAMTRLLGVGVGVFLRERRGMGVVTERGGQGGNVGYR